MTEPKKSTGSGTYRGYHVEVRLSSEGFTDPLGPAPVTCGNLIVSADRWTRVPVGEIPIGGMRNELWEWSFYPHAKESGLMRYETAHGVAAQFHCEHRRHNFLFEFRFVEEEVKHHFEQYTTRASEPFSFRDMEKKQAWVSELSPQSGKDIRNVKG